MSNEVISGLGVSLICGTSIYGELQNASDVVQTLGSVDTTSHNNVGGVKTYRPGWIDTGELSVDIGYCGSAEQDAIMTMFYAKTVSTWTIVAPPGGIARAWSFTGHISSCGTPKFDKDGNATMSFKVKQDGAITTISTAVVGLSALAVTDQGTTALALSPAFSATHYDYEVVTDLADTGVCITATDATSGEVIYINNTLATTATPTAAITIPTKAGSTKMIPVVIFKTGCVPQPTWIKVTHGYV